MFEHVPTAAQMSFIEAQADLFGRPAGDGNLLSFEEATGGRARMNTALPE